MKRIGIIVLALLVVIGPAATVVHAQDPTPTPEGVNVSAIAKGLADVAFWLTLVVTLLAGAVGGVVYELLILQGNIEFPHRPTEKEMTEKPPYAIVDYMYDLGIFARVIIGALAAVAALLVLSPSTTFGVLATAVVAGSAGTSVFRSMQDRLSAAIAQKDAADTKAKASMQTAKLDEARAEFAALKKKLAAASTSAAGTAQLRFAPEATLDQDDLDKVESLLSEARGVSETI